MVSARYGEIPQSDRDDDFSPVLSSPSTPFLPSVDLSFTPLSFDSEFDDAITTGTHGRIIQATLGQHDADKPAFNTAVPIIDSKSSRPTTTTTTTTTLHTFPPTPVGFSPNNAVDPSQSGDPTPSQASGIANENSASNMSRGSFGLGPKGHGSYQPVGMFVGDLSQSPIAQQPVLANPRPIVRTASTKSVSLRHPAPDANPRSSSRASNIAQLEATAEQLSITSSIDDAIRELHDEQKRADSRRSSILVANIPSIPENDKPVLYPIQVPVVSSIRETNNAARLGGYSPAGYVMSPDSSIVSTATRLRSGSTSMSKSDADLSSPLSRHGPGKGSVHSVRSITKPGLTNIAEVEPTALTAAAMDEADRLGEEPDQNLTPHILPMLQTDLPQNTNLYFESSAHQYWDMPMGEPPSGHDAHDRRSTSAGSDGTFEQAERAFANFDGAHCAPDVDIEEPTNFETLFATSMMESSFNPSFQPNSLLAHNEAESSGRLVSLPIDPPTARPKSYIHPETGESMLYYPARVPMMLNLPQKLSKKPKPQARNNRRSQVMNPIPSANRQSLLLPEFDSRPLMESTELAASDPLPSVSSTVKESHRVSSINAQGKALPVELHMPESSGDNRMSRISMFDPKRGSQIPNLDHVPPQLRASTYFELPPQQVPTIQLKDGSATHTLDEILNASTKAPVSAFTDHAFAGSLGTEVYGTERKRKSLMKNVAETHEPKNRNSIFHLRKSSALSHPSTSLGERHDVDNGGPDADRQPLSRSVNGELVPEGDEEEEEGDEPVYQGAPTTLLAELQMRKHQQKLRTRPAAAAFPNGMHSTLLEMDTVAEVERRARKGKKVNLAWENPESNPGDDSEDEDTPLGLLFAAKGQEVGMVNTVPGAPRPLGLMERRDMEDNEPLSVRRNRLQGREAGPIQRMTLARALTANGVLRPSSSETRAVTPKDEIEGETLGERMRRLKGARSDDNNSLPDARPVSSSFSAELLSQLGDAFKMGEEETKDSSKDKVTSQVPAAEEEETLGQRRRRLQAEREAREREMARLKLNGGGDNTPPQLAKRNSLADILGGNGSRLILSDPRLEAERARQEKANRYKEDQERKLGLLRSQISNLSTPNLEKPRGFMSGRFNDGTGGGRGQPRGTTMLGTYGHSTAAPNSALHAASAMGNAFRVGGAMSSYGPAITNTYSSPYGAAPAMQSAGQMASIERWRQDIS
ncbi:hypothetical protein GGR50DRAFT_659523 [Xylaria sp. CBS 124048]|nr:hypothetical protein GGR50DRAFT_659523 [Xylaria sp. CBS 124048]